MKFSTWLFGMVLVGILMSDVTEAKELKLGLLRQPALIEQVAFETEDDDSSEVRKGPFIEENPQPKTIDEAYGDRDKQPGYLPLDELDETEGYGEATCNDAYNGATCNDAYNGATCDNGCDGATCNNGCDVATCDNGCDVATCNNGCDVATCDNGCDGASGTCNTCKLGKPWQLPQPCFFQRKNIVWGGWVQHGITFNPQGPANRFNGPVATNDRDGEYQMNQLWMYLLRPTDTGGYGVDIGGRVDVVYGSDFRFGINHGLENRINNVDQTYGLVIPQMYLELAINNLTIKAGHFAGILDYEAIPAVANPFYSHSYGYGYGVPQLVTGMMGDLKLGENLSVQTGFHRGWMMFEDINNKLDFMGGVKWQSTDKRTSLALAASIGPQFPPGENDRFVYSLVAQRQLTEKMKYVLVHNYGHEENTNFRTGENADWYGITQYLQYQLNPCISANMRFEWFRDDDGARIWGVPNAIPGVRTWDGAPGFAGDFFELTLGVNWRPNANIVVRPEVRWDWYDGTTNLAGQLPFDDGNSDDQFLLGVDMIVTF